MVGTVHDLSTSSPESLNALDQSPGASGPCGSCHLPHHSDHDVLLWARKIPRSAHMVEGLCISCHAREAPASGKIPAVASHPQNMVFSNTERHKQGQEDFFPLFEPDTVKEVINGVIACPSCHDGHRWSPRIRSERADQRPEGDSSNSFLRNVSFNTICVDCHGAEALYRYQYFHDPEKRAGANTPTPATGWSYRDFVGMR